MQSPDVAENRPLSTAALPWTSEATAITRHQMRKFRNGGTRDAIECAGLFLFVDLMIANRHSFRKKKTAVRLSWSSWSKGDGFFKRIANEDSDLSACGDRSERNE